MIGVLKKDAISCKAGDKVQYDQQVIVWFHCYRGSSKLTERKKSLVILLPILYTQRVFQCSSDNDQPLAILRCLGKNGVYVSALQP